MKIVYTSNTGSTKRYAEMLSAKTGYECVALSQADDIAADEEIFYFGWVMAGTIQGLAEARRKFGELKAVCAVGMLGNRDMDNLKNSNAITEPLFALFGVFDVSKLKGMYKMMMSMMMKMIKSKLKESGDPSDIKTYHMLEDGVDLVKEENLAEILEFLGFEAPAQAEEPQTEQETTEE